MKLIKYIEIENQHRHIIKMLDRYVCEIKGSIGQEDYWYIYERNMTAIEGAILKVFHTKGQGQEHIDVIAHQVGLYVWISEEGYETEIEFLFE